MQLHPANLIFVLKKQAVNIKYIALLLVLCVQFGLPAHSQDAKPTNIKEISVISPAWPKWTNEDGTGFYFDLIRSVYNPEKINIRIETATFLNSKFSVITGKRDIVVGIFKRTEQDELFITPQLPIDREEFIILSRQSDALSSHSKPKIMIPRGYLATKYFDFSYTPIAISNEQQGFKMLLSNNGDFLLTTREETVNFVKAENLNLNLFNTHSIATQYIYLGFTNNKKGQKLAEIYDRRVKEFIEDGTLEALYQKWDTPNQALLSLPAGWQADH